MKVLYFLSLLILCQGIPLNSAPEKVTVTTHLNADETDLYFVVNWNKVSNIDDTDPILGFKLTVYEGKLDTTSVTKKDGSTVSEVNVDLDGETNEPNVKVAEINVDADKNEYIYHGMKEKVLYLVTVQAYTAKSVGPPTKSTKFTWL